MARTKCDCGKCLQCYIERVAPFKLCSKTIGSQFRIIEYPNSEKAAITRFMQKSIARAWGDEIGIEAEKRTREGTENLLETWLSEFMSELNDRRHTVALMWKILEPFANTGGDR